MHGDDIGIGRETRHLMIMVSARIIIASEMLLGGVGVGFFIWDQYNASRISDIIVALVDGDTVLVRL